MVIGNASSSAKNDRSADDDLLFLFLFGLVGAARWCACAGGGKRTNKNGGGGGGETSKQILWMDSVWSVWEIGTITLVCFILKNHQPSMNNNHHALVVV